MRFFIKNKNSFIKNEIIKIESTEFHHLKNVMRAKEKDIIEIINGKNYLAEGEILKIKRKEALVQINKILQKQNLQKRKLILAIAFLKISKLEIVLEKATELGTDEFILFPSKNSKILKISKNRQNRFQSILISAIKQCKRLDLPIIKITNSIKKINFENKQTFFGDLNAPFSFSFNKNLKDKKDVLFFIGPEKGFSKEEIVFLKTKGKAIKINENTLRAETAAIAFTSLFSFLYSNNF